MIEAMGGRSKMRTVCVITGCAVMILTAILHSIGHISGAPPSDVPEQAALQRLMDTVKYDIAGSTLTQSQIMSGFSWSFSAGMLFPALLCLATWRSGSAGLVRCAAGIMCAYCGVTLVISVGHFPIPPIVMMVLATAAFLAGVLAPSRGD